ncbi:MAG TPA: phosphate signaling complex protein PhoU [Armatimonadota bacterium]
MKATPRQQFEQQLNAVQQDVLRMGSVVEQMLHKSMEAYRRRDPSLVEEVQRLDDVVDKYNLDIETECLSLLALQNPMARDLRVIAAALKIITDIERVGDYCIDIARTAGRHFDEPPLPPLAALFTMTELVNRMLRETLQAFVNRDLDLVQQMILDDDEVDHFYRTIHDDMVALIRQDGSVAAQAVATLMTARYLERIADHITNVGERVYYVETGDHKELHQ